ncbi:POTRA domain-containing protein [Halobacteriovorax marinus]|uniref:POTRA domain-containing protein n=1 Tax=Halobacteriovorax marinus TaxID=97084 RepID=UPI003A91FF5F
MDLLKILLASFILISLSSVSARTIETFDLSCTGTEAKCLDVRSDLESKINGGLDSSAIKDYLNLVLYDNSISKLSFNTEDSKLNINISFYKKVESFKILHLTEVDTTAIERLVGLSEGSFYKKDVLEKAKEQVLNYFIERGYTNASIKLQTSEKDYRVSIEFNVTTGSFTKVKDIEVVSKSPEGTISLISRRFNKFQNKVWNKIDLKFEVERLAADLFNQGYFSSTVSTLEPEIINDSFVKLRVKIDLGDKNSFSFHGNNIFTHQEILLGLKESIKSNLGAFSEEDLRTLVVKMYENIGIFNTDVSVYRNLGTDKDGQSFINYFFNIHEGIKIITNSLSFVGNIDFSIEEIRKHYYDNSTVLATRGFLDLNYVNSFSSLLREKYLRSGYVQVDVSKPRITYNKLRTRVDIEYRIKERQKANLERVSFNGVPLVFRDDIRKLLTNKKNKPVNVLEVDSDIDKTVQFLKSKGYFFAVANKLKSKDVLIYDPSFTIANLNIDINLGDKVTFNDALISGYSKTKRIVIEREMEFSQGEILTPEKVQDLKNRLTSLGLFSSIEIKPLFDKETKNYNLLIQVQEKDFGTAFFAPGYRTDIGYKVSVGTNYNNIGGMNRIGTLRAQVNRRDSYRAFDARRRSEEKDMLEFYLRGNLTEPYFVPELFGNKLEADLGFSVERKRYYEFDADRLRISPTLSKKFNDFFSASLKYQWERINQYDATSDINNDDFNIGGITPGVSLDFRDDPISPRRGSFFSLSVEFANKFFGSMDNDTIKVNYYKLVSRNRFYYPMGNFVFALSASWGVQKNFANQTKVDALGNPILDADGNIQTEGYIPSIKVFRLNGVDIVRGFAEDEINILLNDTDIGDTVIRDKAYFANLKFEARYSVTDTFVMGPFLDAGRVFVDKFQPLKLRSAVGLTLKYITPVGSLDFDYGVKTRRFRRDAQGRESFGRFHLSIGFF